MPKTRGLLESFLEGTIEGKNEKLKRDKMDQEAAFKEADLSIKAADLKLRGAAEQRKLEQGDEAHELNKDKFNLDKNRFYAEEGRKKKESESKQIEEDIKNLTNLNKTELDFMEQRQYLIQRVQSSKSNPDRQQIYQDQLNQLDNSLLGVRKTKSQIDMRLNPPPKMKSAEMGVFQKMNQVETQEDLVNILNSIDADKVTPEVRDYLLQHAKKRVKILPKAGQ